MTEREKWENIFLEDCAEYDKKIKEEQIEQKAEERTEKKYAYNEQEVISLEAIGYKKGFKDGYHECQKEHEWHKVSEVGLPKNDNTHKTFLLWTTYGKGGSPVVASFRYRDEDTLENVWNGRVFEPSEIVEWKECDLPKGVE